MFTDGHNMRPLNIKATALFLPPPQQLLSQELAANSSSGKVISAKCDVRREDEIKAMFEMAKSRFGGVDVCVNNAGLGHDAPLLTGETDQWREMLEVHARPMCLRLCQYA